MMNNLTKDLVLYSCVFFTWAIVSFNRCVSEDEYRDLESPYRGTKRKVYIKRGKNERYSFFLKMYASIFKID